MPTVGLALVLFAGAFLVHLVRWRIAPPSATARALLVTFVFGILGGLVFVVLMVRILPGLATLLPPEPFGTLQALLLSLAFAAGYVMTYPAIEVESPTLVMIQAIARRGDEGLARATLFAQLNDEVLVAPRVRDLLSEGLAVEREGRLHLSTRGRRLVNLFFIWRRLLGASAGG
jgi:hypothetical protein